MRLIDADKLKKCAIPCEIQNGALTDLCVPLYQIDNAPTVYPICEDKACKYRTNERPHGKWIYNGFSYRCSKCGKSPKTLGFCGSTIFMEENFKYCPNCGAKMDGKEAEES